MTTFNKLNTFLISFKEKKIIRKKFISIVRFSLKLFQNNNKKCHTNTNTPTKRKKVNNNGKQEKDYAYFIIINALSQNIAKIFGFCYKNRIISLISMLL